MSGFDDPRRGLLLRGSPEGVVLRRVLKSSVAMIDPEGGFVLLCSKIRCVLLFGTASSVWCLQKFM